MRMRFLVVWALAFAVAGCQSVPDKPISEWSLFRKERPVEQNEPAALAEQHFVRGDYGLAERYFREAVERNASDVLSWFGLAATYDHLKRFDLADRAYDQVLELNGPSPQYYNNRGYSHLLRGEPRRAEAMLKQARIIDPIDPVIANNAALVRTGRTPF
jgi:Flp pilus assembly protein TadD